MNIERLKRNEIKFLRKLALIQRQLGNISSSLMHTMRGVDGSATHEQTIFDGYMSHLKCDVADMFKQCRVLAGDLGFKVNEIHQLGDSRYEEAKDNFIKKGKLDLWI